jgi:hypothetical protein
VNDANAYGLELARTSLQKFHLLDDMNRNVFRQLLISRGVQKILGAEEKGLDFIHFATSDTQYKSFGNFLPASVLPHQRDRSCKWRWYHACSIQSTMLQFFHRRSTCSCIKNIYYNLKDNTPKKTYCNGCRELNDAKNIFECECKQIFYCSRECSKRDWARHQIICPAYKR